jgi:hypothetical protein
MARYEVTLATGEKIVVDHGAAGIGDFLAEADGKAFLMLKEITGAAAGAARDIVIASRQITMIRPLGDMSSQGSNFRPKR